MRKILFATILVLSGSSLMQAQTEVYQIPNSDFNSWAADNEPGNGWNSFPSAGGTLSGMGKKQAPNPSKDTGRSAAEGDYSCKLYSKSALGINANGNLTTGRINMGAISAASSSNYNYTARSTSGCNLPFSGRPDAVEFYAKFKSGGSPNGRAQFILHGDVDYRDPEVESQSSYKVGMASVAISTTEEWQHFSGTFSYVQDIPSKQYMLASFTTNPTPGGSKGDELWIDDVRLIYYHALSELSYEGTTVNFNEETLNYDLSSETYEAARLSFTKKGEGATVETAYDEETYILTITVKGNDYAVNPASLTVYQLQFASPSMPDPTPIDGLGEKVEDLEGINMEKTYVLFNAHFNAYAVYDADYSTDRIWTAGMIGDDAHPLRTSDYSEPIDLTDAGSSWMIMRTGSNYYLYNMGALKYANIPGYGDTTMPSTLVTEMTPLQALELTGGMWAFTATGGIKSYMCAAPHLEFPVSIWESNDVGAGWQIYENPNIAADPDVLDAVTAIEPVKLASPNKNAVYTIAGVKVKTQAADVSNLPSGVYIVGGQKVLVR